MTITPKSATSRLKIVANVPVSFDSNGAPNAAVISLFRDSDTDALSANWIRNSDTDTDFDMGTLQLSHDVVAGSTASTTFKVRVGTAGSTLGLGINGDNNSGTGLFGGTLRSTVEVIEYTE